MSLSDDRNYTTGWSIRKPFFKKWQSSEIKKTSSLKILYYFSEKLILSGVMDEKRVSQSDIEKIERHFDATSSFWVDIYCDSKGFNSIARREQITLEFAKGETGSLAVDLGCGSGHALFALAELGFEKTLGVDISGRLVDAANIAAQEKGLSSQITAVKGDVERLDKIFSGTVDLVLALGLIEYLENDDLLLCEIFRILKPGGTLIIQVRNRHCIAVRVREFFKGIIGIKGKIWFREHSPKNFRKNLESAGFAIEKHRFSHFYPLFPLNLIPVIRDIIKPIENPLQRLSERFGSPGISALFASMFIVKARKPEKNNC